MDLWILTANEINIMKKKLGPISVVLYCFRVPCVRQFSSKRGRGAKYSHLLHAEGSLKKNRTRHTDNEEKKVILYTVTRPYAGFRQPDRMAPSGRGRENISPVSQARVYYTLPNSVLFRWLRNFSGDCTFDHSSTVYSIARRKFLTKI